MLFKIEINMELLEHCCCDEFVFQHLSIITVSQMSEMEISRMVAERSLREHMGNVVEALVALTN